jgi:hypothetical protein
MTYRFVGTFCAIDDGTHLEVFGQSIELDQADAERAILQNAALVPEADFEGVGFTQQELEQYSSISLHEGAPAEFLEKRKQVWSILHAHRQSLLASSKG